MCKVIANIIKDYTIQNKMHYSVHEQTALR